MAFPMMFQEHKTNALDYIRSYADKNRTFITNLYFGSRKYYPKIIPTLKRYGIPQEFAALVAIESNFNPKVVSRAGAVGWWQFMDQTAREYGLKVAPVTGLTNTDGTPVKLEPGKKIYDDRWNLAKATNAAAKYLRDSYRVLGDWLLVAAAYNCGLGRVKAAMAKSEVNAPTFWDIKNYLPAETRSYVLKLITLNVLFTNFGNFSANDMIFDDITVERKVMLGPESL